MRSVTDRGLAFRPDLQGLRAIAILLVMLAHAGLAVVPGGFIGVDVFFVLSGYLISGLLLSELSQDGRIGLLQFYARRLRRLLPALVFMLCVVSIAAIWLLSRVEARGQLASAPFAATWTSNLYFAFQNLDYFDELASEDLFLHTWSLGVEEQFYLVWPAVLLIWSRFLVPGMVITFLASLAISLYWAVLEPQSAFYLMPARVWQFSLGALVFLAYQAGPPGRIAWIRGLVEPSSGLTLASGLILIFGSAVFLHSNLAYLGLWVLVPSLGAALVIAAGHRLSRPPEAPAGPLAHPVLVWIGDRSYSLYLWHWPILVLGYSLGYKGQLFPILGLMLLTVLLAALSFRLIELPFWKGRFSGVEPRRALLVSLLVMFGATLVQYHGLRQLPQPITGADVSNQWRQDMPIIYGMPCDVSYTDDKVVPCLFGKVDAKKTVVLLGDSIGVQWFSMVPEIYSRPDWRTFVLTKSACAMVDEDYFYRRVGGIYQACSVWRNAVLDRLDRLRPEVVIVGSAATYDFSETQWVEGSARVLARLSKAAGTVFVVPGTPKLGFDGPGCVSRHLSQNRRIDPGVCLDKGSSANDVALIAGYLERASKRFPNVHVLNLNDLVCPDARCSAISKDGQVVFRDSQHLMDSFVRAQVPIVRERLQPRDRKS